MNSNACSSTCGCGCGQAVTAVFVRPSRPAARFIKGHNFANRDSDVSGYKERGRTRVHVERAEHALGRSLPAGAEVHHADNTKSVLSPLVICQDRAYHMLLHVRARIVRAGGDPDTQAICSRCRLPLDRSQFYQRKKIDAARAGWASAAMVSTCKACSAAARRGGGDK